MAGCQFCAGLEGGCEAAVHCMSSIFERTGASLFVDASNAFNSLNCATTLLNVSNVCQALAPILINTYREPVSLFVNGEILLSTEGTTQGDPLGMAMYAIGVQPLINSLESPQTQQVWYADDSAAGGNLEDLHDCGPNCVVLVQSTATIPTIVRPVFWLHLIFTLRQWNFLLIRTGLEIVSDGVSYLGGVIGSEAFICLRRSSHG